MASDRSIARSTVAWFQTRRDIRAVHHICDSADYNGTCPIRPRTPMLWPTMLARTPTSVVLDDLLSDVPGEQVTLEWLLGRLGDRSFGLVLLLLALLGLLPGMSAVIGVLLMIPAIQMVLARPGPMFPRRISTRCFDVRRMARVVQRVLPALRWLERFIRPRWATPFEGTKRVVGGIVQMLACSLLIPVPLSNVPLALTIALIACAYLEEDGILLCAALALAAVMLVTVMAIAWETLSATGWVSGFL